MWHRARQIVQSAAHVLVDVFVTLLKEQAVVASLIHGTFSGRSAGERALGTLRCTSEASNPWASSKRIARCEE